MNKSILENMNKYLGALSEQKKNLLFGNKTNDSLGSAFDVKRTVHPGVRGEMILPKKWQHIWLDFMSNESSQKRNIYIHIPFCQTECHYCGFFRNFSDKQVEDVYIDKIILEIEMSANMPFMRAKPFHAVYIGGGTPTALSSENIIRLLSAIRKNLYLSNDCEVTFESRIYDFENDKIKACIDGGVNRFSFGIQSFDTRVRRSLARVEATEKLLSRLKYLCDLGHAAIVIDLMYGLPGQTAQIWAKDVQTLIESEIDGCDLYQLNVYKDSKLEKYINSKKILPAAQTREQAYMFKTGVELLSKKQYKRLSICHWARNTRERNVYNSSTKAGADIVPFGAGAAGKINGYSFRLDSNLQTYFEKIDQDHKPIAMMLSSVARFKLHSEVISQFESGYFDLDQIAQKYDPDLSELLYPLILVWLQNNLVKIHNGIIELTISGQFWYVNLTQAVLDYLEIYYENGNSKIEASQISQQG